jgi:hypothetical protein
LPGKCTPQPSFLLHPAGRPPTVPTECFHHHSPHPEIGHDYWPQCMPPYRSHAFTDHHGASPQLTSKAAASSSSPARLLHRLMKAASALHGPLTPLRPSCVLHLFITLSQPTPTACIDNVLIESAHWIRECRAPPMMGEINSHPITEQLHFTCTLPVTCCAVLQHGACQCWLPLNQLSRSRQPRALHPSLLLP